MFRKQNVVFYNTSLKYVDITSDVCLGIHLKPLLFLMYINNLPKAIRHRNIILFADDVKL